MHTEALIILNWVICFKFGGYVVGNSVLSVALKMADDKIGIE